MKRKVTRNIIPIGWQTGFNFSIRRDAGRRALKPGWRRSKNGLWYFEARRNRSDLNPKTKL